MKAKSFEILDPVNGDMLYASDGVIKDDALFVTLKIAAAPGKRITVNGSTYTSRIGIIAAEIPLNFYRNAVDVKDEDTGEMQTIELYRLDHFQGKYRLSIDDNIWFLQDLTANAEKYTTLFDNPFMGFLKALHDEFGTKVHLNIFYQTEGFDLSVMTDKFKPEWIASADWIRLSFHALQEFPDKPYISAGYEEVKEDCELVMQQVERFAGKQLTGPVTTVHWGETTVNGSRALRDAGYKGQLGYFNVDDDLPAVSYYLDVDKRRHIKKRFIWKDTIEDIIFIKTSIVIDTKKHGEIIPFLDSYKKDAGKPPYLDLLVHEQYYYPFYQAYQPDYCEKIRTSVKWAVENGYEPAFLEDCILDK